MLRVRPFYIQSLKSSCFVEHNKIIPLYNQEGQSWNLFFQRESLEMTINAKQEINVKLQVTTRSQIGGLLASDRSTYTCR